jgi:hypothetical protein
MVTVGETRFPGFGLGSSPESAGAESPDWPDRPIV